MNICLQIGHSFTLNMRMFSFVVYHLIPDRAKQRCTQRPEDSREGATSERVFRICAAAGGFHPLDSARCTAGESASRRCKPSRRAFNLESNDRDVCEATFRRE